jgi:hypothetical protein
VHISLDRDFHVDTLLHALHDAGTAEQATALADRLPSAGMFKEFLTLDPHRTRYRFGRGPGGLPAPPWRWDDLD